MYAADPDRLRLFGLRGLRRRAPRVHCHGPGKRRGSGKNSGRLLYACLLYTSTSQSDSIYDIRELRLISGSTVDKRYSLPASCIGATVWNRTIYALSATQLLRAGLNDSRFTTFDLPLASQATQLVDRCV